MGERDLKQEREQGQGQGQGQAQGQGQGQGQAHKHGQGHEQRQAQAQAKAHAQEQEKEPEQPPAPQPQLVMVLESLARLPALEMPDGYAVRGSLPGDEAAWERIIAASFGGEHHFDEGMASDGAYAPERVWFIVGAEGELVATASAWYRPAWEANTGYLHMVGLLPEQAGKKLGRYVSHAALLQMAREGRTRAVLHTDDFRVPAIKTYLGLGFVPAMTDESHPGRWAAIAEALGRKIEGVQ